MPASAGAHGLVGKADLPIPMWLFVWAAAAVLVLSFAALGILWSSPRLEQDGFRPLPGGLSRALTGRAVEAVCGFVGVALLVVVILCGFFGTQLASQNIAPTFVYVAFWLGFVPVSVLFGDVFRAFNPWRAAGRAVGWQPGMTAHCAGVCPSQATVPLQIASLQEQPETAVHVAATLAVTGVIAFVVYRWVGLAILRSAWINFDSLWTVALLASGALLLFV